MIVPSEYAKTETVLAESDISPSEYGASESGAPTEKGQSPPSYDDSTASTAGRSVPGPSTSPTPITGPRVNHIYVKEPNHSVKGEWTIDPTIRVPSSLLAQLEKGEERVNLRLHSQNGSVAGKVRLISDQPTKSFLYASSQNGSVAVKILYRNNQHFWLKMHSQNGSISARIPSDFEGPVTFMTKNGSLKFSESVERRLAHYSRSEKTGKAFIGDWATSGYAELGDDVEAWSGDELVLSTMNGSIKIEYAEESPEVAKRSDAGPREGPFQSLIRRFMGAPTPTSPTPSQLVSPSSASSSLDAGPMPLVVIDRKG